MSMLISKHGFAGMSRIFQKISNPVIEEIDMKAAVWRFLAQFPKRLEIDFPGVSLLSCVSYFLLRDIPARKSCHKTLSHSRATVNHQNVGATMLRQVVTFAACS